MKSFVLAVGFLSVALAQPVLAGNLVPASDHFIEARADADATAVALGTPVPIVTSTVVETRSYNAAGTDETFAREPASRMLERRPGGPAARVAASRPWVGTLDAADPG